MPAFTRVLGRRLTRQQLLSESETAPLWQGMDDILESIGDDARPVLEDTPWETPDAERLDMTTVADKVMSGDAPAGMIAFSGGPGADCDAGNPRRQARRGL
jgi:hypothetical protein